MIDEKFQETLNQNWWKLMKTCNDNAHNYKSIISSNNINEFIMIRDYICKCGTVEGVEISYSKFENSFNNLFLKLVNGKIGYFEFVKKLIESVIRNYKSNGYKNNKELNKFLRHDFRMCL